MNTIIERINQHHFWHFHGGIHPPEQKILTSNKPIKQLPLPKQLILPLQQHIGGPGDLLVNVGDKVLKGQPLTKSTNPMTVPIHAPTSGIISDIKKSVIAHPSALSELCIFIDVDFEDTWQPRNICQDFTKLSPQQIISKIADAGIAGMGGAGFPTHIKINTKPDINFLIINAAECEPYITADDLLMCEQSEAIVDGIKILDHLLKPTLILIGIEDNKPKAIKALEYATKNIDNIRVCVLPTKYPTGGEKQLIKILTGKEIKSGALPIHSGIIVQNVATCFAISDAVINDIPLIRRVVTVTGQALSNPQNVWALLGTPVRHLLEQTGFTSESSSSTPPVIMGGPLMGFTILNELVPIVKTSNCILAPSKKEMPSAFDNNSNEVECIRCGQCAEVCPSQLLPQEMQWSAKAKDHPQLLKLNLFDCIDCGACAYVCPSQIPLVQYYRVAKAEIRQQQQLDIKAEKAKVRFEARKLRLEKEKAEREEKHKKAAAARKATMNKKTADGGTASSAVAAALARVKAKKQAIESNNDAPGTDTEEQNDKSQVQAAIARAKAKKLMQKKSEQENTLTSSDNSQVEQVTSQADDKKARIAAAVAKAKAKKNNEQESPLPNSDKSQVEQVTSQADDKKARIAAAVAKAKAKKNNEQESPLPNSDNSQVEQVTSQADDKKARIAAAVAKAKAKKNNEQKSPLPNSDNSQVEQVTSQADDKKARIAAAVAKAKAKVNAKKAQEQEALLQVSNSDNTSPLKPSNEELE
jgi:electron transport complex protein RnfC